MVFYTKYIVTKIYNDKHRIILTIRYNFISVLILGLITSLDSWWYGHLTLAPVKFLLFNFVNNFSKFYGEHSWHWYLTNALPSLMGPVLFPVANSILYRKELNNKTGEIALLLQLSVASYVIFHRWLKCRYPKLHVRIPSTKFSKIFWKNLSQLGGS